MFEGSGSTHPISSGFWKPGTLNTGFLDPLGKTQGTWQLLMTRPITPLLVSLPGLI